MRKYITDDVYISEGMGYPPPPMDPSMMGGMMPPPQPPMMDPNMMGGMPPGPPPMDPNAGMMPPPMDPSMMGGMSPAAPPMDPAAAAGLPPGSVPMPPPAPPIDPAMAGGTPPPPPPAPAPTDAPAQDPNSTQNQLTNMDPNMAAAVSTPPPSNTEVPPGQDGYYSDQTLKTLGLTDPAKIKSPTEILDEERRKREWKLGNCNQLQDEMERVRCYRKANRITVKRLIGAVKLCQGAINPSLCREVIQEEINAILGFHSKLNK